MFRNCRFLESAPSALPAWELAQECYANMFWGCESLVNAPEILGQRTEVSCFVNMFKECTSLIDAPELNLNRLTLSCCSGMFAGCTSLVNPPALPMTELAISCYSGMFEGCTSLEVAPVLPATQLEHGCYDVMFRGCSNLSRIEAMFLSDPGDVHMYNGVEYPNTDYTNNWVDGVAENGVFVKNSSTSWETRNNSAIPRSWEIELK